MKIGDCDLEVQLLKSESEPTTSNSRPGIALELASIDQPVTLSAMLSNFLMTTDDFFPEPFKSTLGNVGLRSFILKTVTGGHSRKGHRLSAMSFQVVFGKEHIGSFSESLVRNSSPCGTMY